MLAISYVSLLVVSFVNNVAGNCLVSGYCGVGQCCSAYGACGSGAQYCGGGGSSYLGWSGGGSLYVANDCRVVGCRTGGCCSAYGHCGQSIEYCGGGGGAPFVAPAPIQNQCGITGCPGGSCCSQQGQCGSSAAYCATVTYNNCGATSCGVGLCCTRYGYCDRVGPYCGYKKSGSNSESVSLEGEFKGEATYYNETKAGTQYSTCGIARGLSLDENNQTIYSAALNQAQFDPFTLQGIPSSNPICQKKAVVKGPVGEIIVRFIDRCPDCKANDIGLTQQAFIAVAGELGIGRTSVVCCTLSRDVTLNQKWKLWKDTHNKHYSDVEEHLRRTVWGNNLKIVEEHNLQADLGVHTYWLEMNKYADLTVDEFVKVLNGFNGKMQEEHNQDHQTFTLDPSVELPDTVDWRKKGDVVHVKDQGQCGSCWAFSAVGAIESANAIKTGVLVALSEQQLVDCSGKEGNMGCNGGLMDQAFKYVKDAGGIETENSYPYEAMDKTCVFNTSKVVVKVCGFIDIASEDEIALQQAVATIGPMSVAIDASHSSFQLYKNGVYNEPACSQTQLDHGVLAIGYGKDSGKDYWLVKNSWGTGWGAQGYIKMTRNKKNQCGIATMASYPIIC
ncbi:unnamed protein product [Rotaria socialis]